MVGKETSSTHNQEHDNWLNILEEAFNEKGARARPKYRIRGTKRGEPPCALGSNQQKTHACIRASLSFSIF
jgi:hypothetical protein